MCHLNTYWKLAISEHHNQASLVECSCNKSSPVSWRLLDSNQIVMELDGINVCVITTHSRIYDNFLCTKKFILPWEGQNCLFGQLWFQKENPEAGLYLENTRWWVTVLSTKECAIEISSFVQKVTWGSHTRENDITQVQKVKRKLNLLPANAKRIMFTLTTQRWNLSYIYHPISKSPAALLEHFVSEYSKRNKL